MITTAEKTAAQTKPLLDIKNVTVSFDGFKAINGLNFKMGDRGLRVIIGPNGAGKTTFLDVITGKVQPTTGRALFKGKDIKSLPEHAIARLGIGRKFQTPRVYLNLTPRENLELSCNRVKTVWHTLFKPTPTAETRTVSGLLETIGLSAKSDVPAALLSHGEKQWLEIGMLVAQSPDLLLVDEPVAGLTDEETERTGNLLISLAESHGVIVIEHDMEFVRQIAQQNKVTVLHEGSVLCEGSMDEIQSDPRVIKVYLGDPDAMIQTATASTLPPVPVAPTLKVFDLNVYYGESHILRNVDMTIPQSKMVCLIGRNGVGKTTLLKTVMGLLAPRSGQIDYQGRSLLPLPTHKRAKLGIGYVPQGREVIPRLTVRENLLIGLEAKPKGSGGKKEIPEDILQLFPVLKEMLSRMGGDLSGGQQQQLAIARALMGRPQLLVLDEPTEGIQPSIILDIENAVRQIVETSGMSVLLVEQHLHFAQQADYYYAMQKGGIVASGEAKELSGDVIQKFLAV